MNDHVSHAESTSVSDAVATRRSLRAFLPEPIPRQTLEALLQKAARAPSGTNMQPWKSYVLTGRRRQLLCEAVCAAFDDPSVEAVSEVDYYPTQWFEPYLSRRRQVGWSLYGLLGIGKRDRQRMHAQHRRNFQFFDAPVGLIFTVHRDLATGSWLDYGMYLQNIMLLAREQGLHTCPQAAWADHHAVIRRELSLQDDEIVLCGMALGHADPEAIENTLVTERVPLAENTTFLD
ncbi:nitroreductase [Granulosicoccus sp. 3-233]|uniref:nitroreductase n=1 Tax=Granulosicoccus sp. 3-233 TaxID=3417969 RepID=UPI003D32A912